MVRYARTAMLGFVAIAWAVIVACEAPPTAAPTTGTEPIADDPAHNVYIPPRTELTRQMQVAVVYNDEQIQFRYEVPTEAPSWYHQYLVYEDGEWVRYGDAPVGPHGQGLYEDRVATMIDDGAIEGFETYGGHLTMHPGIRGRSDAVDPEQVEQHPWLGQQLGRSDVRKFIPDSREGEPEAEDFWSQVRDGESITALREAGTFIDSIQWRAHRSNPIGYGDNGYVLEYRHSSEGRGMYTDNWDEETEQPLMMFDEQAAGLRALRLETLLRRGYGQDDPYYLYEGDAVAFDPDHDWQEGDAIPQRLLRQPEGSRGSIRGSGHWSDGAWHVRMTRPLEPIDATDSKRFEHGEQYHIALATHLRASGGRWHYASMPLTLGLGTEAMIEAKRTDGDLDEAEVPWTQVPLYYPGQVTYAEIRDEDRTIHHRYMQALGNRLEPQFVQDLAEAIVAHELDMLRRKGLREDGDN